MTGQGRIYRTTVGGPYGYEWRDDEAQVDLDNMINGVTLAAAYNALGSLAQAMSGQITQAFITVRTDTGKFGRARIFRVSGSNNYAYTWKASTVGANEDSIVTGKTLGQAFNEVGALGLALTGSILVVEITPTSE